MACKLNAGSTPPVWSTGRSSLSYTGYSSANCLSNFVKLLKQFTDNYLYSSVLA